MVKLIRKKIEIFDQKIGKDSPDRVKFTLKKFSKIHYAELNESISVTKLSDSANFVLLNDGADMA